MTKTGAENIVDLDAYPIAGGESERHDLVDRADVVELPFTPAALLIVGGRRTLHRVTPIEGDWLRRVPVLCYSTDPDQQNSDDSRRLFWGRTTAMAAST